MAAQSPAQPAKTEKGEACSKEPQGQASVLQQSSLQKNDAAQEEVEVHAQKADHITAAQSDLNKTNTSTATASVRPAPCTANLRPAKHDFAEASGPEVALQAVGPPLQQRANQNKSWEPSPVPRREAAAFTADTPDELDMDFDEEMLQRLQQPQLAQHAQQALYGRQSGTGGSTGQPAGPPISSDKEGGSVPSAAQCPPTRAEASSLATAAAPSAGLPDAPHSKVHVSESAGQQSAAVTAAESQTAAADHSDPSGPRAKKRRIAEPGIERSCPPTEGKKTLHHMCRHWHRLLQNILLDFLSVCSSLNQSCKDSRLSLICASQPTVCH